MANKPLKSIKFPGLDDTYTVAVTDTTLSESGVPADAKVTGDALETKADKDGYYTDLTAGTAEQLLASQFVEDKIPYLFRTSGGSIDIGDREYEKIIGGTLAWNQALDKNTYPATFTTAGVTFTNNGDGSVTANGTASETCAFRFREDLISGTTLIKGHKYFCESGLTQTGSASTFEFMITQMDDTANVRLFNGGTIFIANPLEPGTHYYQFAVRSSATVENVKCCPIIIDITQMFGSTIADYIYSLEQSFAGAGVAWFKALFPKLLYDYNAGELLSVSNLQSHDTVVFNQWDEEWEAYGANQIKAKNRIPLIPGETYYCNFLGSIYFYEDLTSSSIGSVSFDNATITIPENAHYGIFYTGTSYGNVYKNDICLNLSWSGYRNGEYEPYEKHSYPLDSSLTLRGIPKLDAENNLYYDGDEYASDGTVTRRYGIVDLGTLSWNDVNSTNDTSVLFSVAKKPLSTSVMFYGITTDRVTVSRDNIADRTICMNTGGYLIIRDSRLAGKTGEEVKTALSGQYLVYELATASTEEAEPYTNPQIVNDFGTEEYVTTSLVPVGHETQYPANLRDKLQHLPDLAENDGYYAIKQEGSQLSLELFRIPKAPTTDGNYTLKASVTGGVPTYTWESEGE